MIQHLDADHAETCLSIVHNLARVAEATSAPVSSIDRYGVTFDARGIDGAYLATVRVAFSSPLTSADEVRAATVDLARRATTAHGD